MRTEIEDLQEHLERYRSVTLQVLDCVTDAQLAWRPAPEYYTLGQQLLHIAQAEDFHSRGLFDNDWNTDRVRLPRQPLSRDDIRDPFERVRRYTMEQLARIGPEELGSLPPGPEMPVPWSLRSGLWFILEHELHHKGQIWLYLRQMGITPPFYAFPLPLGERPDIAARQQLGGF